jgi:hypothetical protein
MMAHLWVILSATSVSTALCGVGGDSRPGLQEGGGKKKPPTFTEMGNIALGYRTGLPHGG